MPDCRKFNEYDHVFEDLTCIKERIVSTRSRRVNRVNAKHDYRKIQKMIEYKTLGMNIKYIMLSRIILLVPALDTGLKQIDSL